jgi:hypothetical protein
MIVETVLREAALYSVDVSQRTGLMIDLWVRPAGVSINAIDTSKSIVLNKVIEWAELRRSNTPVLKDAIDKVARDFPRELKQC